MNHSPEPWKTLKHDIGCGVQDSQSAIAQCWRSEARDTATDVANADRIVACVNALAGVPDEAIPGVKELFDALRIAPVDIRAFDPKNDRLAETLMLWVNSKNPTPDPASQKPPPGAEGPKCTDP